MLFIKEGFIQREKYVLKQGNEIYDDFYCSIYDQLVYDNVKNDFEVGEIKKIRLNLVKAEF